MTPILNTRPSKARFALLIASGLLMALVAGYLLLVYWTNSREPVFDGVRALKDVQYQVALGPRVMGSPAHDQIVTWMEVELLKAGWEVETRSALHGTYTLRNIVARRGQGRPWIVLGAHYDSRFVADNDPDPANHSLPVPGANDGASGVAVLLELARALPENLDKQIWLVFFDAEDNGRLPGWDWILGSRAFVAGLADKPDAAIIVDMIGDADLEIYLERNSDPELSAAIWEQAADLGYTQFIPQPRHSMIDDHTPFLQAGIPAVDIIDFDYPYWHTVEDTVDKVSAESLEAVGATLLAWLMQPDHP
jgi:Zn-dependent M28 family amino/carboxypeptidase